VFLGKTKHEVCEGVVRVRLQGPEHEGAGGSTPDVSSICREAGVVRLTYEFGEEAESTMEFLTTFLGEGLRQASGMAKPLACSRADGEGERVATGREGHRPARGVRNRVKSGSLEQKNGPVAGSYGPLEFAKPYLLGLKASADSQADAGNAEPW